MLGWFLLVNGRTRLSASVNNWMTLKGREVERSRVPKWKTEIESESMRNIG